VNRRNTLRVFVTYVDVSGRSYTTEAAWDRRAASFTYARVVDDDTARLKLQLIVQGTGQNE
jgi:hypothetical protein